MTAQQKLITELEDRLTTSGLMVYIIDTENKASTTQLANRLITDGFSVIKITDRDTNITDRGVLIINQQFWKLLVGTKDLRQKIKKASAIKFIMLIGDAIHDDFPDWERVKQVKLDDIRQDGKTERIHLDIWKRVKVEV